MSPELRNIQDEPTLALIIVLLLCIFQTTVAVNFFRKQQVPKELSPAKEQELLGYCVDLSLENIHREETKKGIRRLDEKM